MKNFVQSLLGLKSIHKTVLEHPLHKSNNSINLVFTEKM